MSITGKDAIRIIADCGLTGHGFAILTGVSKTTVSSWSRGRSPDGASSSLLLLLDEVPERALSLRRLKGLEDKVRIKR